MSIIKNFICIFLILLLLLFLAVDARHVGRHRSGMRRGAAAAVDTVQIAGSRLPDCSHACGSCKPCRLVMVSFVCSSIEEAETCPMAYKCMCRAKSYPVP